MSDLKSNIVEIENLKALHRPGLRLFGLDLGTKTIGLALSDGMLSVASPYHTIRRTKFTRDASELAALSAKEGVFALVIGMPLNMDGSEGPRAQATRAFVRNLADKLDLPVTFWDERLSTVAAERAMIEADLSRAKRAEKIDAAAAAFILQGALDRLARL
ncbi:MAG: Holliday junction resolvase RuvX [Nitratireductor sp.]|nr:Holliday junction resolvase RuvX [Nitratireductor sp.]